MGAVLGRVEVVLGRAQGQRGMALKDKEESPTFSFSLGLPRGKAVPGAPWGQKERKKALSCPSGVHRHILKAKEARLPEWPPLGPAHQIPRLAGPAAALVPRT